MKKLRIYLDTSVIGGCFDEEFNFYSNKLFDYFYMGIYIPVISDIIIAELQNAPENIYKKITSLDNVEIIDSDEEMISLAKKYIEEDIVSDKWIDDALHIAIATVNKTDVLVSWNFKHIVNLNKINKFNSVNIKEGYHALEIRSPREIIEDE